MTTWIAARNHSSGRWVVSRSWRDSVTLGDFPREQWDRYPIVAPSRELALHAARELRGRQHALTVQQRELLRALVEESGWPGDKQAAPLIEIVPEDVDAARVLAELELLRTMAGNEREVRLTVSAFNRFD